MMRITLLSSILMLVPAFVVAQGLEVAVGYQNDKGTIEDSSNKVDMDVTGYTISGKLDVSERLGLMFGYGSGNASVTIGGTETDLDILSSGVGVLYYVNNNLDGIAGRGIRSNLSLQLTNTELTAGSISQKGNSERVAYSAEFPVVPRLTTIFSASSRLNSGSNYDVGLGLSYYFWSNKNSFNIGYSADRSDEDGVQTTGNGISIFLSFKN